MGFFRKELGYVLILFCGSTFVGQSLAYYSPAGPPMTEEFGWSSTLGTFFSTLSSLVAIVGGPLTNLVVPYLGRKNSVFMYACVAFITWILIYVTKKSFSWLAYVARAIQGLCVGGLSSTCSMYIVEISPPEERGAYGTIHQFGVTLGMAYCYLLGIFCSWRTTTILCGLFALILLIGIWFVPESPVAVHHGGGNETLFQKKYLPQIIASVLLMFFQQFSGINALDTNLETVFEDSNVDLKPSICALLVGLSQCISTAGVSFIVEKFGRKKPFVISAIGQAVALILTWINEKWNLTPILPIIAIFLDFFFFGIGFGPIPWFIVPELFPDSVRQLAVSLSTCLNWIFVSVIVFVWPEMKKGMGMGWGFFLFALICAVGAAYGVIWMPETGTQGDVSNKGDKNDVDQENDVPTIDIPNEL